MVDAGLQQRGWGVRILAGEVVGASRPTPPLARLALQLISIPVGEMVQLVNQLQRCKISLTVPLFKIPGQQHLRSERHCGLS